MKLTSTIFRHEWLLFTRQRWMPFSLLLFAVIAFLAIFTGRQEVRSRLAQIDSMRISYQRDLDVTLKRFADTSTAKAKADARNAGMAVVINFRLPQTAVKEPAALAALCVGQMDVMPWYSQVKFVKSYNDEAVVPVSNPLVLFAGNFDYAFVLIYLLPLLIISWCYAIYDSEKNAGTLRLLAIQSGRPAKVIRLKLLFRFALIGITIMVLNISGFLLSGTTHLPPWQGCIAWCILSLLYAGFWFTLCRAAIALRASGSLTALALVSGWVLVLIVGPSLANAYTQAKRPLPLKDELSAYRRHQAEIIWKTSAAILSDSFNRYKPAHASTIDLSKDTVRLSSRYVAGYYELLDQRMKRVITPYNELLQQRRTLAQNLLGWDPALLTQNSLAALSENDAAAYEEYFAQVDSFQQQWQEFLYPYHFSEQPLDAITVANKMPHFKYQHSGASIIVVLPVVLVLAVIILLLLSTAGFLENKHEYN